MVSRSDIQSSTNDLLRIGGLDSLLFIVYRRRLLDITQKILWVLHIKCESIWHVQVLGERLGLSTQAGLATAGQTIHFRGSDRSRLWWRKRPRNLLGRISGGYMILSCHLPKYDQSISCRSLAKCQTHEESTLRDRLIEIRCSRAYYPFPAPAWNVVRSKLSIFGDNPTLVKTRCFKYIDSSISGISSMRRPAPRVSELWTIWRRSRIPFCMGNHASRRPPEISDTNWWALGAVCLDLQMAVRRFDW